MRILVRLALRNLTRRPLRSAAAVAGAALAVFLHAGIESLSHGLDSALARDEAVRTLIVYRKNRYCPQTSRLPEAYREAIAAVAGVTRVAPQRVYMNNCRANLDLVLFLGVDATSVMDGDDFEVVAGSGAEFVSDPAAALVGRGFAQRRGVGVGESFRFGTIDVKVAGIFAGTDPVKDDAILTHLAFLQRAIDGGEVGAVTQFEVTVTANADPDAVARAIDATFATRDVPTETFSRSEFLARATGELAGLVDYARLFGRICVVVLCVLLANATLLAAAERSREHALMLAIGYRGGHVASTLLLESAIQSLAGGVGGAALAFAMARFLRLTIGIEGIPIALDPSPLTFFTSIGIAAGAAALAATIPAWLSTRVPVASALRGA